MTVTIQKWGNSQGVRIPKTVLNDLNLSEGQKLDIVIKDKTIVLKTAAKKRKTIQELFANYEGDYKQEEIDWGVPVGKEIW